MPRPDPKAPVPFAMTLSVAELDREAPTRLRLAPDAAETAALAAFLGLDALEAPTLEGEIRPIGPRAWQVAGRLRACATQPCVVTLAPVLQTIDEPVLRDFVPVADLPPPPPPGAELELHEAETDPPEPFEDALDLGQLLIESLALAIDPYPRAAGAALGSAVFAAPGVTPLDDEAVKPFAQLAKVRAKLEGGE